MPSATSRVPSQAVPSPSGGPRTKVPTDASSRRNGPNRAMAKPKAINAMPVRIQANIVRSLAWCTRSVSSGFAEGGVIERVSGGASQTARPQRLSAEGCQALRFNPPCLRTAFSVVPACDSGEADQQHERGERKRNPDDFCGAQPFMEEDHSQASEEQDDGHRVDGADGGQLEIAHGEEPAEGRRAVHR